MAEIDSDNESDPIIASYDVFAKPGISEGRQIYVLQFPNRDAKQRYSENSQSQPLNMRIKPEVGMVEIDVPMMPWNNYDRTKGLKWGDAIRRSNVSRGGGSHGLPGGFGIGSTGGAGPGRGRGRGALEDEEVMQRRIVSDYANVIHEERVLLKQTLGGQAVPAEANSPQYMIGTFRSNQLHLTPVDKIVQMRPQFHHIDAHAENERTIRVRDAGAGRTVGEPKAVHMTVKSNIDGEEESADSMGKRITTAQSEAWKNHRYIDEDTEDAWNEYKENMFVGKHFDKNHAEVLKGLPKLLSSLNNSEYLDTISAPRITSKPKKRIKKERTEKEKSIEGVEEVADVEEDNFSSLSDPPSDTDMGKHDAL